MTVTYQELQALVGKDIEFFKPVEEYVENVDAGMRATIIRISDDEHGIPGDPCFQIHYTLAKFDAYNRDFEKASFYDSDGKPTLTLRQTGHYSEEDSVYVGNDWQACIKLVDSAQGKLFDMFMIDKTAQPDITYVAWLETLVLAAMPYLKADG